MPTEATKTCRRCHAVLPATRAFFAKSDATKDGLKGSCLTCGTQPREEPKTHREGATTERGWAEETRCALAERALAEATRLHAAGRHREALRVCDEGIRRVEDQFDARSLLLRHRLGVLLDTLTDLLPAWEERYPVPLAVRPTALLPGERYCPRCRSVKPATREHFGRSGAGLAGLKRVCLECERPAAAPLLPAVATSAGTVAARR